MTITISKINCWKQNIRQQVSAMPINSQTIEFFSKTKKRQYNLTKWEDAVRNNTEEKFIKEFLENEAMKELKYIQQIIREDSLNQCICIETQGSKYEIASAIPMDKCIIPGDCFVNVLIVAMSMNNEPKIIYGIAEDASGMPRIHAWNKIGNIYVDYTWEFFSGIGNKYWEIKEMESYELLYIIKHLKNQPSKLTFHRQLINGIDHNKAKQDFKPYMERFESDRKKTFKWKGIRDLFF